MSAIINLAPLFSILAIPDNIMASSLSCPCTISFLLMLFISPSFANSMTTVFDTPDAICNSTPHPNFCKSILPYDKPGTIHDYGRISIDKSLSYAQKFLSIIENFLHLPSTSYESTILALEDCRFLAQLNIDSLSRTLQSLACAETIQSLQAYDLQTRLSATLTNQETCLDDLKSAASVSSVRNGLLDTVYNGTMHFSVCLALFTHGWVHDAIKGRFLTERKSAISNLVDTKTKSLRLKMSPRDRQLFETVSGRKLLQSPTNGVSVSQMVVLNPNGSGNYTTVSDAVAAAPNNSAGGSGYFAIYVVAGVYNEYVSIPKNKKYLMMIGDGINKTVITSNRNLVDGWTTFNSATFAVVGEGFLAVSITFRNTAGAIKHQAVAVRNGADLSTFYSCSFEGYQDTLYTHSLRQFYRDCDIYGTIDYIFGNAAVVFQNCNIYSRLPMDNQFNTITAQGRTDPNQNTGTSIQNCSIKAAPDLVSSNGTTKSYLGRPWKKYSRTIFMESYIGGLIDPVGWAEWAGTYPHSTLYYAEFYNTGPGSNTTNRVTWPGYHVINANDAANFAATSFIQGNHWLPATNVPYTPGL